MLLQLCPLLAVMKRCGALQVFFDTGPLNACPYLTAFLQNVKFFGTCKNKAACLPNLRPFKSHYKTIEAVFRTGVLRTGVLRTGVLSTDVLSTGVLRTGVLRTGVLSTSVLRADV